MDELLALFEEAASHPEKREPELSQGGDDSSVEGGHHDGGQDSSRSAATQSRRRTNAVVGGGRTDSGGGGRDGDNSSDRLAASSDAKTGIRMVNRQVSGADLMDLLVSNPYHSPASLCAMSLQRLNELLVDPPTVVDAATVCGRTHLVTVGVVFSSSGTRMSSAGNAFCVWTLGTLQSGPAVSVLLFGSAYGRHCRSCRPGKVVAILGPRLLEAAKDGRSSSATAVSFSVSDDRQVTVVADAKDYGTCPAKVRGKNDAGQWSNDARTCGRYADTSICAYCAKHRNLAGSRSSAAAASTAKPAMQQLRSQSALVSHRPFDVSSKQRILGLPTRSSNGVGLVSQPSSAARLASGDDGLVSHLQTGRIGSTQLRLPTSAVGRPSSSVNRILNPLKPSAPILNATLTFESALSRSANDQRLIAHPKLPNNSILNRGASSQRNRGVPASATTKPSAVAAGPPSAGLSYDRKADPRLLRNSILNPSSRQINQPSNAPLNSSLNNPYAKRQSKPSSSPPEPPPLGKPPAARQDSRAASQRDASSADDWMDQGSKRKAERAAGHNKRARTAKLNVDTAGFDGSVAVPKPSLSFASGLRSHPAAAQPPALNPSAAEGLDSRRRSEVLALQTEMAAKLRELKASGRVNPTLRRVTPRRDGPSERQAESDGPRGLFGTEVADTDLDAVRAARSQFADEAAAEDYALMRNRLVELEQQEEAKEGSNVKNRAHANGPRDATTGLIQKEWVCQTCHRAYKALPKQCYRAGHHVKANRSLPQGKTSEESRRALSEKRVEEGGLKLGSGLEWSGPR